MKNEILNVLGGIKSSTGIECAIYKFGGELICSTVASNRLNAISKHIESVISDGGDITLNISYIIGKKNHVKYVCVVSGADNVSRNYAHMVWQAVMLSIAGGAAALTKAEKFKMLLTNELDENAATALKSEFAGKPVNFYVLTLITESSAKLVELKNFLEAISERDDIVVVIEDKTLAYIKSCGTDDEYQSANDFAHTLYDNIKEEVRINFVINVGGTAHSFDDLKIHFRQCAFAYGFGKMFNPFEHIYSYKEYTMIKMLADIPKGTLTQYLGTLLDKSCLDIISDDELMNTAEEFLKNSLNISETSRSMYMHRNTLIYRLDKIENATGLNLRRFNDAVIFKLITILYKLTSSKI